MKSKEYSDYQKSVISGYHDNIDTIMLQKLSELVSELYLAETEAKQNRLWERIHKAMINLKIPQSILEHIMQTRDVKILAKNLNDWHKQSKK